MTDYFDTTARIRDRVEALARTLNDPALSLDSKVEEIHAARARIEWLEDSRPLAQSLSAIADLAAVPGRDEE